MLMTDIDRGPARTPITTVDTGLPVTPADWMLYSVINRPGRVYNRTAWQAARNLTSILRQALAIPTDAPDVDDQLRARLRDFDERARLYRSVGAYDTEPREVFLSALIDRFGIETLDRLLVIDYDV
jgi:hypothetical protein